MAFSDFQLRRLFTPEPYIVEHRLIPRVHDIFSHRSTHGFASPSRREFDSLEDASSFKFNPSGLDLTVGSHIAKSKKLETSLTEIEFFSMNPKKIDGKEHVLLHNKDGENIYYILSEEKLNLPDKLDYFVDARSTTGRVGVMCHQAGKLRSGEVIFAVQPFAFPIKITSGKTSLSQAVVRYGKTGYMSYEKLQENNGKIKFSRGENDVFIESLREEGLLMTFSSSFVYKAKDCDEPIDMDSIDEFDPSLYFEIIEGNGEFAIDARTLYLAGTREIIGLENICGRISRENPLSGTGLWSHFAGIVQSGFYGPITLECYSSVNRKIRDGDPAGFVKFDEINGPVLNSYKGSYQNQTAPRLPKMFKQFVKV